MFQTTEDPVAIVVKTLFPESTKMDYVFEGPWSDNLHTEVQSLIDKKWASWGEGNPGQELIDFIQVCRLIVVVAKGLCD